MPVETTPLENEENDYKVVRDLRRVLKQCKTIDTSMNDICDLDSDINDFDRDVVELGFESAFQNKLEENCNLTEGEFRLQVALSYYARREMIVKHMNRILNILPSNVGAFFLDGIVIIRECDFPKDFTPDIWDFKTLVRYREYLEKRVTELKPHLPDDYILKGNCVRQVYL